MQRISIILLYAELVLWALVIVHLLLTVLPYFQFHPLTFDYLKVQFLVNVLLLGLPHSVKGFRTAFLKDRRIESRHAH